MGYQMDALIPSFGMLANSHLGLVNVKYLDEVDEGYERLHRARWPGSGAVTDFQLVTWRAEKDIEAGEEIFVNYGENYFFHREEDWNVTISTLDDFKMADETTKKFEKSILKSPTCSITHNTTQNLWNVVRDVAPTRVKAALPPNVTDLPRTTSRGTARFPLNNDIRPISWLRSHGQCLDNLSVKSSTAPGAGRGAFATRFVPRGGLVAPAPLVHVRKGALNMYDLEFPEEITGTPRKRKDRGEAVGVQLLMNYCFGHAASEIVMFPYSPGVQFINHKKRGYNAEIRWSVSPHHRADWLETSVNELFQKHHTGLIFDIVAIRDIQPGEEVFINYGNEWDEAWNRHVDEWTPVENAASYVHPEVMNKDLKAPFKIMREQNMDAYPPNIQTVCYYYLPDLSVDWEDKRMAARQKVAGRDKHMITVDWLYDGNEYDNNYLRPCDILDRNKLADGKFEYRARMYNQFNTEDVDMIPDDEIHVVNNLLHEAIRFAEKPYSNDQFLQNAFRHYIGIPDEMLPEAWIADNSWRR